MPAGLDPSAVNQKGQNRSVVDVVVTLTTCRTGFDTLWVSDSGRDLVTECNRDIKKR